MNASANVTYLDLVKEVADLPPDTLALLIDFARVLRLRHWATTSETQTTHSGLSQASPIHVVSIPASELLKWSGKIDLGGGNALEDTERLYDGTF